MRIAVVGLGPAGATFTIALKQLAPHHRVDCFYLEAPRCCGGAVGYPALSRMYLPAEVRACLETCGTTVTSARFSLATLSLDVRGLVGVLHEPNCFESCLRRAALKYCDNASRGLYKIDEVAKDYDLVIDARGFTARPGTEVYVVAMMSRDARPEGSAHIELEPLPGGTLTGKGYRWLFRAGDYVNLGVMAYKQHPATVMEMARSYASSLGYNPSHFKVCGRGAVLSTKRGPYRAGSTPVFPVGTAAGLVDPVFGAGIKYALVSSAGLAWRLAKTDDVKAVAVEYTRWLKQVVEIMNDMRFKARQIEQKKRLAALVRLALNIVEDVWMGGELEAIEAWGRAIEMKAAARQ